MKEIRLNGKGNMPECKTVYILLFAYNLKRTDFRDLEDLQYLLEPSLLMFCFVLLIGKKECFITILKLKATIPTFVDVVHSVL